MGVSLRFLGWFERETKGKTTIVGALPKTDPFVVGNHLNHPMFQGIYSWEARDPENPSKALGPKPIGSLGVYIFAGLAFPCYQQLER